MKPVLCIQTWSKTREGKKVQGVKMGSRRMEIYSLNLNLGTESLPKIVCNRSAEFAC